MSVFKNACLCVINLLKSASVVSMEQAKSFNLLINVKLREHRYADVVNLVDEEDGLTWSVFRGSGLLGNVVEMADM